jgi:AcrR family transcriptional regulator
MIYEKPSSTADLILHTAYQLFIKQGYSATSMRCIAKETGIALSSIYNHFTNKEDLFRQVFFTFHPYHDVLPFLEDNSTSTAEEFIRNAISHAIEALDRRPGFLNLMFIEIVEFNGKHIRELFEMLYPRAEMIPKRLARLYPNQFKPIPPLLYIRSIIAFIFGFFITDALIGSFSQQVNRQMAINTLIDIFCHGVLNDVQQE